MRFFPGRALKSGVLSGADGPRKCEAGRGHPRSWIPPDLASEQWRGRLSRPVPDPVPELGNRVMVRWGDSGPG